MLRYKGLHVVFNELSYYAKLFHDFRFCTRGFSRIWEVFVELQRAAREERASFFCMIAYGDDKIERYVLVCCDIIGSMLTDINPIFRHGSDSAGIYPMCFHTGAVNLCLISGEVF